MTSQAKGKVRKRSRGRPTQQDAAAIRGQLLDAAAASFHEQGYGAASVGMIAERARITKKTFYNHFNDKRDVFEAVSQRDLETFKHELPEKIDELELEEALREMARSFLDLWSALASQTVRMIFAEGQRFPNLAEILRNTTDAAQERVTAILRLHASANTDVDLAAQYFVRMIHMGPQEWMLLHPTKQYPAAKREDDLARVLKIFERSWLEVFVRGTNSKATASPGSRRVASQRSAR